MKLDIEPLFGDKPNIFINCETYNKLLLVIDYLKSIGYGSATVIMLHHVTICLSKEHIDNFGYSTFEEKDAIDRYYGKYPFYKLSTILENQYDIETIISDLDKLELKLKDHV